MKKLSILMLALAVCQGFSAHNPGKPQQQKTIQKGSVEQTTDSATTATNRPAVMRDTMQLKLNRRITSKKAAQTPPFKMPKKKAEEPWVGWLLKDIVFH